MTKRIGLITGGGDGIGRGCAFALAQAGFGGLVIADINETNAQATAELSKQYASSPDYETTVIKTDVSSEESVEGMVDETMRRFGRIDASVHCAGVGVEKPGAIDQASVSEFTRFFDVNVKGTFLCTKHVSRAMRLQKRSTVASTLGFASRDVGRGSIINLGSAFSFVAAESLVQYVSAKHAVLGVTKTAAADNAKHGIRVNTVCPSWVDTPMISRAMAGDPGLQGMIERVVPLGRMATVDEVAELVVFLSGPSSSYLTGTSLAVDGGITATGGH
ncbi:MAG: hypothetical protein Q9159_001544 [Coniocarpon cinnabarinum]